MDWLLQQLQDFWGAFGFFLGILCLVAFPIVLTNFIKRAKRPAGPEEKVHGLSKF